MKRPFTQIVFLLMLTGLLSCESPGTREEENSSPVPDRLPLNEIELNDLTEFREVAANWQTVGSVSSDFLVRHSFESEQGSGVLSNLATEDDKDNLFTNWEHGDLELEIEFMVPKESNSGIYFQARYEIQILDSWGVKEPNYGDCGGIYQRWDESKPDGEQGYEGAAPRINASKAPGLWQKFHVLFRAPRFDASGQKTENARFEYVYHNGFLIHENVELTGPTRGSSHDQEVAIAPVMFQGDHGPVAFRNIRYKRFGPQVLELSNITYQAFLNTGDYLPAFDTLSIAKTGLIESLDSLEDLVGQADHFALKFEGNLRVPLEGKYLFETAIDDGGDLTIDGQLVIHNDGDPGFGVERGLIFLTRGTHDFELTFYEEVWFAGIAIYYEGPGIEKQTLASLDLLRLRERRQDGSVITINPGKAPEMIRGFVNYGSEKRTHTISIGDPGGVHYSYDLSQGALLKCWKGGFADVTNMWRGRGASQLLLPLSNAIEFTDGVPLAQLPDWNLAWPDEANNYKSRGYRIDELGHAVFLAQMGEVNIQDGLMPSSDSIKLVRKLQVSCSSSQPDYWFRIAAADIIEKLDNGLYSIGGQYYLQINGDQSQQSLRSVIGGMELVVPVLAKTPTSEIEYAALW